MPIAIDCPTTDEANMARSLVEVADWCREPPTRYFAYVDEGSRTITTWMGHVLGHVTFGLVWRDSFGSKRQSIRVRGTNGANYSGTYYMSSGNYCRIRKVK